MWRKTNQMLTGPINCKNSDTIISRSATRILVRANIHTARDIVLLSSKSIGLKNHQKNWSKNRQKSN